VDDELVMRDFDRVIGSAPEVRSRHQARISERLAARNIFHDDPDARQMYDWYWQKETFMQKPLRHMTVVGPSPGLNALVSKQLFECTDNDLHTFYEEGSNRMVFFDTESDRYLLQDSQESARFLSNCISGATKPEIMAFCIGRADSL
jgi:hypothetical protein